MCRILGLSRQSYYYQSKPKKDESELEEVVAEEFIRSRKAYGSRKIKKKALSKRGIQISRRKISRIMKNRGLKSSYTVAYFKVHHSTCNEAKTTNVLNRKFLRDNPLEARHRNRLDLCTSREKNGIMSVSFWICSIEKFSAILVENIKMPF
jgi:putative transposase